ncbi:HU family DNA-binding protein [Clostridium sp. AM58-1XD]|uniref:HU family DNA-binding protein n=1 Tax=Clostridium sp. AM58-1XD TaxID=2292307 RepID=UPI000E49E0A6|nr:HU family DNA-binding protein [Clostridium sp. AM58-1XD]RGY96818.1 hypothetical protein DXA13_16105 [Clostridium sp. AM58-1XD]
MLLLTIMRKRGTNMEQSALLKQIAKQSGYEIDIVERVYCALISVMSDAMGKGEKVVCMPEWGRFILSLGIIQDEMKILPGV